MNIVSVRSFAESTPYVLFYAASRSINISKQREALRRGVTLFRVSVRKMIPNSLSYLSSPCGPEHPAGEHALIDQEKSLGVAFALRSWLARGAANSFKH